MMHFNYFYNYCVNIGLIFVLLNLVLIIYANPRTLNKDLEKEIAILFPPGVANETQLPNCTDLISPCNVIENPYFFPFKIHRLCKCPNKLVCPYEYELKRKYNTVFLNNREQIKFCSDLPKCEPEEDSILQMGSNKFPLKLNCFCPKKRHWVKLNENLTPDQRRSSTTEYICEKVKPCNYNSNEYDCGFVRGDTYASYFNCTCTSNKELCMPYKKIKWFEGVSYKGHGFVSKCGIP